MSQSTHRRDGRIGRIQDRLLNVAMLVDEGVPADQALDRVFSSARDLGSSERADITEHLYAWVKRKRLVEDRIEGACRAVDRRWDLLDAPLRMRIRLLATRISEGAALSEAEALDPYAFRRIPGLFSTFVRVRSKKAHAFGIEWSLPDWLAERLVASFGNERATEIAKTLLERAPLALRVNTLKKSRDELSASIAAEYGCTAQPTQLSPDGLVLLEHRRVHEWPTFLAGDFEVQDEGSQLVALAVGAQRDETIYDACAGAGGKLLALACHMRNTGRIVAFDPSHEKLGELKARARRVGLTNYEAREQDFVALSPDLVGRADRVLVDAPCTMTGAYRRHPDKRWRTEPAELERMRGLQVNLLLRATDAVRAGGLVLYATCSVLREENQDVVKEVLARDARLEPLPLASTLGDDLARRLHATHEANIGPGPTSLDPDGFYLALLGRR